MRARTFGAIALLLTGAVTAPAVATAAPGATGAPTTVAGMPSATTTGVAAGTTLTPMSGGFVRTGGTTVSDKVIEGDVTFAGSDLTVRNVRATGHVVFRGDNIVIEDSEFGSWALSGTENVRATGVEVFGNYGQDGLHVTAGTGAVRDVVITDSLIHGPKVTGSQHYDGIQVRGVDGLTLERVRIDLGAYQKQYNAAFFLEDANGGNRDVAVRDSWILGGGYTLSTHATGVAFERTVIGGGNWGDLYPSSRGISTFTGNTSPEGDALTYVDGRIVADATVVEPTPDTAPAAEAEPVAEPEPVVEPDRTPSAATTGVVAAAELAPMSGGYRRDQGTTIENAIITGDVTFANGDLTLRNVLVTGHAIFRGDNLVIEDSEFGSVVLSGTEDVRMTRVDVFGNAGYDGIQITAGSGPVRDVVIRDTWVHGPKVTATLRYQGLDVRGADGLTLDNVLVDVTSAAPQVENAVLLEDSNGGTRNVTITGSRLLGGEHVLANQGSAVTVSSTVLGGGRSGYLAPGSNGFAAFTGNTSPSGSPLSLTGGTIG